MIQSRRCEMCQPQSMSCNIVFDQALLGCIETVGTVKNFTFRSHSIASRYDLENSDTPLYTRFNETAFKLMLSISSSDITSQ